MPEICPTQIPSFSRSSLTDLASLSLSNNTGLSGSFPNSWSSLVSLTKLDVSNCNLCGTLTFPHSAKSNNQMSACPPSPLLPSPPPIPFQSTIELSLYIKLSSREISPDTPLDLVNKQRIDQIQLSIQSLNSQPWSQISKHASDSTQPTKGNALNDWTGSLELNSFSLVVLLWRSWIQLGATDNASACSSGGKDLVSISWCLKNNYFFPNVSSP